MLSARGNSGVILSQLFAGINECLSGQETVTAVELAQAYRKGIDKSYAEAARDLGAKEKQVFFDITLPLIAPAILSGMLLSFAMSLDDVVIGIFVAGARVSTLPVKIYTQLKTGVTPEINALCTLMLIVTVVLVLVSQRLQRKKV